MTDPIETPAPTGVPDDLIGVTEACRLLPGTRPGKHINLATMYRWLRDGVIPGWKIRKNVYVSRSDVLKMAVPVPFKAKPQLVPAAERNEQNRLMREANAAAEAQLRAAGWM